MKPTQEISEQDIRAVLTALEDTPAGQRITDSLETWQAHGERLGFVTPLPERPAPPPAPEAPDLGAPPREDDAKYDIALSAMDRLLRSRRIKKQQAALNRFEKDRKAWNEDRSYALGIYEKAKKKHGEQVADHEAGYEAAVDAWKDAFTAYLRGLLNGGA